MKKRFFLLILIFLFFPLSILEISAFSPDNGAATSSLGNGTVTSEKSWTADFKTTVFAPNGSKIVFTGKFYQNGSKVRFEPTGSGEIDLYDFERASGVRLFPEDRIYFETRLTPARMMKAAKEGWISTKTYPEKRILLMEGSVKERKARLYLIILGEADPKAYSLRWTTADEAALPLQVIYPASGHETVIVEYDRLQVEPVHPEQFDPPADFLKLNPF
jgi:hypothetical protein